MIMQEDEPTQYLLEICAKWSENINGKDMLQMMFSGSGHWDRVWGKRCWWWKEGGKFGLGRSLDMIQAWPSLGRPAEELWTKCCLRGPSLQAGWPGKDVLPGQVEVALCRSGSLRPLTAGSCLRATLQQVFPWKGTWWPIFLTPRQYLNPAAANLKNL